MKVKVIFIVFSFLILFLSLAVTFNRITLLNPLSVLSESFENSTFPPSGWVKITPTSGAGWNRQTAGSPTPGLSGIIIAAPGGGTAVAFCNYLTGSNPPGHGPSQQWLITPKLGNIQAGDSLTFWLRKLGVYFDHFQVMISTTTPTTGAMTIVVDTMTFYANDSGYVFHKYNIGSLVPPGSNIYVGFKEWVDSTEINGASFSLDLIKSTAQVVEVKNINGIPAQYNLSQNFPNPFNPSTHIEYSIAKKGFVSLIIYDVLGKEIAVIVNESKNAGNYTVSFNASKLSSGVYYYKIQSGEFSDKKMMILLK